MTETLIRQRQLVSMEQYTIFVCDNVKSGRNITLLNTDDIDKDDDDGGDDDNYKISKFTFIYQTFSCNINTLVKNDASLSTFVTINIL